MDSASAALIRVYVNNAPVDVAPGASAAEAVASWDRAVAEQLRTGERALTDSRGLPLSGDTIVHGGAIYRVVRGGQREDSE